MPLILDGTAAAAEIKAAAAARAAKFAETAGRPATLAAVAFQSDSPLHFDVKRRAFEECHARFNAIVLDESISTTERLAEAMQKLSVAPEIDGIFLQYPLPPALVDAQRAFDAIAPARDVDGANTGDSAFDPATAESVIVLLKHHDIAMRDASVCIVKGDDIFARKLVRLFDAEGAKSTITTLEERDGVHAADIVVVVTGVINGINASAFRDGAVVIDVGYYHGGGRGDISAHPEDIARLRAYASPRGSIGPLTVALLIDHTVTAAEQTLG
jgi:methylenetetrahydrofolate dehydrogenase (NADP+)/methenyltetrahydrofolate cyclohydrolase